ncbi:MAG TPA: acyl-ACP--UDP-N-acetylglucosamine O-acyltransferase [Bacteroidales bacterium]|nr:acyl-ACP--UDP-N-acetylglucosamine O-acyltransferase [Bacteroidales bacterium]
MISALAHVDPAAQIGANVTIEPFAYIQGDVIIDEGTWIGPHAVIYDGARIGKNCRIFNGASVSAIPQDLKFMGEKTTVEIGDNTTVREFATLNRGTNAKGRTVIGSNCLLMAYVHVAHDCIIGDHVIMVGYSGIAGEVEIGDWAILGGTTVVHQFVHIGAHAILGGGSKVRIDVPPYIKADREPLSFMGINHVGLERRGFSKEKVHEIHEIYRAFYNMGKNTTQALEYIAEAFSPTTERDHILTFIKNSERGVIKGR